MAPPDDPTIFYSVKELISRLDGKLDMMMNVITGKADRADVNAVDKRVDEHERRLGTLETHRRAEEHAEENGTARSRFALTVMLTAVGLLIAFGAVVVTILVNGK